jgi:hypothetical protein
MQIERSDEQRESAMAPRDERRPPGSKLNFERLVQPRKQDLEIVSTDAGIQINGSDEQS